MRRDTKEGGGARTVLAASRMLGALVALLVALGVIAAAPAQAATLPDPPTNVTATAVTGQSGQVTVSWTAPANDGGSPITKYRVAAQPGQVAVTTNDGTTTTVLVQGLTDGVAYTFTVRAYNAIGQSLPSAPSNSVTPGGFAATIPQPPTGVTATPADQSADVSWTPPSDTGGVALTGYRISSQPITTNVDVAADQTTVHFPGLTNGLSYTFTVRASNEVGRSDPSAPSNAVVPGGTAATIPAPPTNVVATPGDSSAHLTWTAPANNGGAAVTGYRISIQPGADRADIGNVTSYTWTGLTNGSTYTFTVRALNGVGLSDPSAPSNAVTPQAAATQAGDGYTATTSKRVLDTRSGLGAPKAKIGARQSVTITVADLPAGVTSVALNLTATNATLGTWLEAYPAGGTRPDPYSNLNVRAGGTAANLVVTAVGAGNKVTIYNNAGSVDAIADLVGYYTPSSTSCYAGMTPKRVLDTRVGTGAPKAKLTAGQVITVTVPSLPTGATAATLNLTATGSSTLTFLAVYPHGTTRPNPYSSINVNTGQTAANLAVTGLGSGAKVDIYNHGGTVDVIADVIGAYGPTLGACYQGMTPKRVLDTRSGLGATKAKVGPNGVVTLTVPNLPAGTKSVVLNLTAVGATAGTYLSVYADGTTRPNPYSNINIVPGQVVANLALTGVSSGDKIDIYNRNGSVDVIADVIGSYHS